MTVIERTAH